MNGQTKPGNAVWLAIAASAMVVTTSTMVVARPTVAAQSSLDCISDLAGNYTAKHMEMAGGIALRSDGSFRYALSYGAVDEEAQGRWACNNISVLLTSDPVKPPRFLVLGTGPAPSGQLHVTLELPPGMSHQYFSLLIRGADGSAERRNFAEDGLTVALSAPSRPVAIIPLLPVYELAGDPINVRTGNGIEVQLRFLANDLGKVAFTRTPLERDGEVLMLQRFGETIRLQRTGDAPEQ